MRTAIGMIAVITSASPCYAVQIGEPVHVEISVTVDNAAVCSFDKRFCSDETVEMLVDDVPTPQEEKPVKKKVAEK